MAKIIAYHPEIAVQKNDGSLVVVKPDLDDYYSNQEILGMLRDLTGAETVGEMVERLEESGEITSRGNLISCRVEGCDDNPAFVYGHDTRLG